MFQINGNLDLTNPTNLWWVCHPISNGWRLRNIFSLINREQQFSCCCLVSWQFLVNLYIFLMIRQTRWQIRLTPEWKKNVSTTNRRYETGFPVSLRLIGWSLLLDKTTGVSWFWPAVCLYWQCEIFSMIRLLSDILEDASRTRTTRLIGWLLLQTKQRQRSS